MASTPPGDGSILPDGWTWSDIGHGALDVVGLVPLFGEGADLVNAAWYAAEGNYLDAGLSVISMVPVVGDIIGKGGKIAKKAGGKLAGPALDALRKMDFKKTLEPLRKHPKIGPHVDKMVEALEKWRKDLIGEAPPCTPGGTQKCPMEKKPTSSSSGKASKSAKSDLVAATKAKNPTIRKDLGEEWFDDSGRLIWPDGKAPGSLPDGFAGPPFRDVIPPGEVLDRYGSSSGSFLSPAGTDFASRALPYDPSKMPLKRYKVIKPLPVQSGKAAPWFGEKGGATQFKTDQSVFDLLGEYLVEID
jgi:Tuberculosis necrotizing toxin